MKKRLSACGLIVAWVLGPVSAGLGAEGGGDWTLHSALTLAPVGVQASSFGTVGTTWMSVGAGVATILDDVTDVNLYGRVSKFLAQDFEVGFELGAWYFSQPGDDAGGINPNLLLRYHFWNEGPWTLFADAGIGLLFSSDNVPAGGTSANFTPRVGIGFTRELTSDGVRLEAGLRWHHISNARILGDDDNPARDLPLLYVGVTFPF
ncbi:MAG: acyloxyacyl hydrolase [Phycisphaeraceae bacterium]|nr:MAG: acyloxyacyl hydrolase [Phycisphaeraceae bacterium]